MKIIGLIFILMAFCYSYGQNRKEINALKIEETVRLDGALDEDFWSSIQAVSDFVQNTPLTGELSTRKTEVKIVYDNTAIYIGATMYDQIDSLSTTLSQRDDLGNADWFGVVFDPYNSGTIGFAFLVTSSGVQIDELHDVENIDVNWNAVWKSEVNIEKDKWVAEIKIPFSALRFSNDSNADWGVNFSRNIRRNRERTFWNHYDPAGINMISQLGVLKGIKDVDSPLRLALTPYVSSYVENFDGNTAYSVNGGVDVKLGINEAFTLDMTLIPDFGQVQFDNQVLNLSPFEVRFNERRQFFTEGTELFNKSDEVFYSRRIGGRPVNYDLAEDKLDSNEVVSFNPSSTQLLNATKITGRTRKGTGVGFFNAVTASMNAEILDTLSGEKRKVQTGPISNYNVFVIDQNLRNNSSIALTNTNVWRAGETYDANVTSAFADIYTKGQKYNFWGTGTVSQLFEQGVAELGHQMYMGAEKSAGNFQGGAFYSETSETFDPNDIGFNQRTNVRNINTFVNYNIYKPFWRFYRMWSSASVSYQRIINPNVFTAVIVEGSVGGNFRNFMSAGIDLFVEPVRPYDYFEPRVDGRYYRGDALTFLGCFISSDYSKPFAIDVRGGYFHYFEKNRDGFDMNISPRFRFNDKWFLVYGYWQNNAYNEEGAALTNDFDVPFIDDDPVFAKRDRTTITNNIDLSYIFNNKMGVTFRLRHYWSKLKYNEFFRLNDEGKMMPTSYTGLLSDNVSIHNNSFNAFTIDMVYRWVFSPGSELSFVWKNSIFSFSDQVEQNYFQNVGALTENSAMNSISLKILYYIDYWSLHQAVFKKKT